MNRQEQEPGEHDPFWTIDEMLCEGTFSGETYTVRMKGHTKQEPSHERREIVTLRHPQQLKDYILIHPYILVPDIRLTVDLFPAPRQYADQEPAIGEVASSEWAGMKQERIGDGQAWYYRQDRTLILWELTVLDHYEQENPLASGGNLNNMWQGFEKFLVHRFPQARRIATLAHDPGYETAHYQGFLRDLGYTKRTHETFSKAIKR
jgi:hypothetical protein